MRGSRARARVSQKGALGVKTSQFHSRALVPWQGFGRSPRQTEVAHRAASPPKSSQTNPAPAGPHGPHLGVPSPASHCHPPQIPHIAPQHQAAVLACVKRLGTRALISPHAGCWRSATGNVSTAGGDDSNPARANVNQKGRVVPAKMPTQSTHKGLPQFFTSATRASRKASPHCSQCLLNPLRELA